VTGPLVSVITPTWQRHDILLKRCIPSVQAQTYPNVEHVVVSDGPDPELHSTAPDDVRYAEVSHHDPGVRWGHWARLAGIGLAHGELIAYLDDDNAYRPDHVTLLVQAFADHPHASFAYSRMLVHGPFEPYEVGADPPAYGQIDTSVIAHRRELLERETWQPSLPTIDWDIVRRWVAAGARWTFVPKVTVDYYR
jgi:glycosyltransferase involved in cell wall biosynthesis